MQIDFAHWGRWILLTLACGAVAAAAQVPAEPATPDRAEEPPPVVMVRVGATEIMVSQFIAYLTEDADRAEAATTLDGKRRLVRELVERELLRQAMVDAGIVDPHANQVAVANAMPLLAARYFPVSPVTDEQELRDYYERHKAELTDPPHVRLSQIFFEGPETRKGPDDRAAARARADAAYARLEAGEPFGELAAELTDFEKRRATKGDMGRVWRDRYDWLKAALEGVAVGEYTKIVERPEGFHIFMLTELTESAPPPFEQARASVAQRLLEEKEAAARAGYLRELRERIPIVLGDTTQQEFPDGLFLD